MSGPKPMPAKEFALRHAVRLNYRLLKVVSEKPKVFKVKCLSCEEERLVSYKNGNTGPVCRCTHKRKFFLIKRTPESHTNEIHKLGYTDYTCTEVGVNAKAHNQYKHSCGQLFVMSKDCFVGSSVPCKCCRVLGYTNEDYVRIMACYSKVVVPAEEYLQHRERPNGMLHRYVKCGHKIRLNPSRFTEGREARRCAVCYPSSVWYRFKVGDVRFKTRSKVEKAFVKFLC